MHIDDNVMQDYLRVMGEVEKAALSKEGVTVGALGVEGPNPLFYGLFPEEPEELTDFNKLGISVNPKKEPDFFYSTTGIEITQKFGIFAKSGELRKAHELVRGMKGLPTLALLSGELNVRPFLDVAYTEHGNGETSGMRFQYTPIGILEWVNPWFGITPANQTYGSWSSITDPVKAYQTMLDAMIEGHRRISQDIIARAGSLRK